MKNAQRLIFEQDIHIVTQYMVSVFSDTASVCVGLHLPLALTTISYWCQHMGTCDNLKVVKKKKTESLKARQTLIFLQFSF